MGLSVSPVSHGISGDMTAMNPFMGRRQSWLFVVTVCTGVDMMHVLLIYSCLSSFLGRKGNMVRI